MPRSLATKRVTARHFGGSASFSPAGTSYVLVNSPVTLPTDAFSVSFWYNKGYSGNGVFGPSVGTVASNEGLIYRSGSFEFFRQGTNDMQVYAYLNAPNDFATPRRLRFRNFYFPKGDNKWHMRVLTFYVVGGFAKCDEYEDGVKLGATHTVDYAGDSNTPNGTMWIGRSSGGVSYSGNMADVRFHNRALTATEIKNMYEANTNYATEISKYLLDDGPTTYLDIVGGANGAGTSMSYSMSTPKTMRYVAQYDCSSLFFNGGSGQDIALPDTLDSLMQNLTNVSVEVKFKVSSMAFAKGLFNRRAGSGSFRCFTIEGTAANQVRVFVENQAAGSAEADINIELNKWNTIVGTYDGTTIRGYLNGKPAASAALAGVLRNSTAQGTHIGSFDGGANSISGFMKSVRVFNKTLTPTEVAELHYKGKKPATGMIFEWSGNEGAGAIAYDTSGNANNGTISGATWSRDVPNPPRNVVGGNAIKNGDLSYVPRVNVPTTTNARYVDGTAGGSTVDIFGWRMAVSGSGSVLFDTATLGPTRRPSYKVSTTGTGSYVESRIGSLAYLDVTNGAGAIYLLPNTQYTYSFYLKTNVISGSAAGANVDFFRQDAAGGGAGETGTVQVNTTQDWTLYTGTFTTNGTQTRGHVELRVYGHTGAGTLIMDAWFSDLKLYPTTRKRLTVT